MKKKLLIPYFSLVLCLCLTGWGCSDNTGEIWLVNKSRSKTVRARIEVCDQTITFKELRSGESQHAPFKVKGECHYTVTVHFPDKDPITQEIGYVTSGFNYKDYLVVTDEGLSLNPEGYERQVLESQEKG